MQAFLMPMLWLTNKTTNKKRRLVLNQNIIGIHLTRLAQTTALILNMVHLKVQMLNLRTSSILPVFSRESNNNRACLKVDWQNFSRTFQITRATRMRQSHSVSVSCSSLPVWLTFSKLWLPQEHLCVSSLPPSFVLYLVLHSGMDLNHTWIRFLKNKI